MKVKKALISATALVFATSAWASEPGFLGFSVSVTTTGFFVNPTLKTVRIENVAPNSPAAKAGVGVGDLLVEVEKLHIAGTKANDLKAYLKLDVGQALRIVTQKPDGSLLRAVLIAEPRPATK